MFVHATLVRFLPDMNCHNFSRTASLRKTGRLFLRRDVEDSGLAGAGCSGIDGQDSIT